MRQISVGVLIFGYLSISASWANFNDTERPYQKKNQYFKAKSPEESIKTIEVPKGYYLQCVASEPMVQEPASFVFDEDGAMYVCEWLTYMQDEYGLNQKSPKSRVVKLIDTDGDGIMDKRTVFIDNVILPRTILPLKDRILVNFTNENNVWAYFDDNNDGVSDRRELAFKGGKIGGNIEHQESGMIWNLDNWIYCHTHRFKYIDGQLIKESYPKISQWGLARDDDGRIYGTWAGGANPLHSFQVPAGYPVIPYSEHKPNFRKPNPICRVEDQSSGGYNYEKDHILNHFSAPCGQTILRSPLMPEWYAHAITPEPVGRLLRMSQIKRDSKGGRVAYNKFPGSEFIRSSDPFFRPVWSESGPDGCLYFSDMYRGIIQEKNWFPHKGKHKWVKRYHRVKEWGMIKVVRHGRIYRLVPKNQKPLTVPKLKNLSSKELISYIESKNGWVRDNVQKLLVYNQDKSVVGDLIKVFKNSRDVNVRLVAIWSIEGLGGVNEKLLNLILDDNEERIQVAGIHLAEAFLRKGNKKVESKLLSMIDGASQDVALQLSLSFNYKINPEYLKVQKTIYKKHPKHEVIRGVIEVQSKKKEVADLGEAAKAGAKIYNNFCFTCHAMDGMGTNVSNESGQKLAPALRNHTWFKKKNIVNIVKVLLKGEMGPINGKTYGEGIMLPLENMYSDKELSELINYIGFHWNGWKSAVSEEKVKGIRVSIRDRKKPYTRSELEKSSPKKSEDFEVIAESAEEGKVVWKYTFDKPSGNWTDMNYNDKKWKKGLAGFGTDGTPKTHVGTEWNSRDIWLRRIIYINKKVREPHFKIYHDEGFELYINGEMSMKRSGYLIDYKIFPVDQNSPRKFKLGKNIIAIHCRQSTGGQYFDLGLLDLKSASNN